MFVVARPGAQQCQQVPAPCAANVCSLPTTYIVAPKPSDVAIKYLLVFSDDSLLGHAPRVSTSSTVPGSRTSTGAGAGAAGGRGRSPVDVCWALACAYLGGMVLFGLWKGTLTAGW
jgi:hypothetical protein